MNYDIVVFGVKDITETIVQHIIDLGYRVDLIVTIHDDVLKRNEVSGFSAFDALSEKYSIPVYRAKNYKLQDQGSLNFFRDNTFRIGISMGWQRLIPKSILERFSEGIFGFHGSCGYLPFGRGDGGLYPGAVQLHVVRG